jgi:hypothetical protein
VKEGWGEFRRSKGRDRKLAWERRIMSRKKNFEDKICGACRMHG